MYLVDTNVWLERLLNQDKADDVRRFLEFISPRELYITDFSFHSIGVVLTRFARVENLSRLYSGSLHRSRREPDHPKAGRHTGCSQFDSRIQAGF